MKYLITYDTISGDILGVETRGAKEIYTNSGNGTVNGSVLTGSGLSGTAVKQVVTIDMAGRKMRSGIVSVDSDTQITLTRQIDTGGEPVGVDYKICDYVEDDAFSLSTATDAVVTKKAEVGHQNVAALRLSTGLVLAAHTHFVDISDGNKIKKKEDQIVYE